MPMELQYAVTFHGPLFLAGWGDRATAKPTGLGKDCSCGACCANNCHIVLLQMSVPESARVYTSLQCTFLVCSHGMHGRQIGRELQLIPCSTAQVRPMPWPCDSFARRGQSTSSCANSSRNCCLCPAFAGYSFRCFLVCRRCEHGPRVSPSRSLSGSGCERRGMATSWSHFRSAAASAGSRAGRGAVGRGRGSPFRCFFRPVDDANARERMRKARAEGMLHQRLGRIMGEWMHRPRSRCCHTLMFGNLGLLSQER